MPHYKDGTLAKVGDAVTGTTYNYPLEVSGVVVRITEGSDTCNCTVAFVGGPDGGQASRLLSAKVGYLDNGEFYLYSDYSECKALLPTKKKEVGANPVSDGGPADLTKTVT